MPVEVEGEVFDVVTRCHQRLLNDVSEEEIFIEPGRYRFRLGSHELRPVGSTHETADWLFLDGTSWGASLKSVVQWSPLSSKSPDADYIVEVLDQAGRLLYLDEDGNVQRQEAQDGA